MLDNNTISEQYQQTVWGSVIKHVDTSIGLFVYFSQTMPFIYNLY